MVKKKYLLITIIILSIFGVILFSPAIKVLSIQSRKLKPQIFYSTTAYSKGFVISYTHSVNKGRVHDFYRHTKDDKIELYKTAFVSYGAGIPEPQETPGAVFSVNDDDYEISGLNRIVPKLFMAVGTIANHTIIFDDDLSKNEVALTDFFEPQTTIIFEYKKISIIEYIIHSI
ncbi:MAG: DUF1850 domain-containing protein [Treponema sp.]|nr:DUF1850 domain-containing protein [Treponema sp.]